MVEKGIRGGICNSTYRYPKANNKCKKDYDKNKDYSRKIRLGNVTSQFNEDFIENYNEESDEGYFLEVDVKYLEKLHNLHNDSTFLPEIMRVGQLEKLVANLYDKTECVIH